MILKQKIISFNFQINNNFCTFWFRQNAQHILESWFWSRQTVKNSLIHDAAFSWKILCTIFGSQSWDIILQCNFLLSNRVFALPWRWNFSLHFKDHSKRSWPIDDFDRHGDIDDPATVQKVVLYAEGSDDDFDWEYFDWEKGPLTYCDHNQRPV